MQNSPTAQARRLGEANSQDDEIQLVIDGLWKTIAPNAPNLWNTKEPLPNAEDDLWNTKEPAPNAGEDIWRTDAPNAENLWSNAPNAGEVPSWYNAPNAGEVPSWYNAPIEGEVPSWYNAPNAGEVPSWYNAPNDGEDLWRTDAPNADNLWSNAPQILVSNLLF